MATVTGYFKNIVNTVTSVFDGMTITFAYLFQKPITVEYPNRLSTPVQKQISERFRGFLQVDYDLCTSCDACAKACPIDCITLDGVRVPGRKGKAPYFFYIDLAKCMYCGLCVEVCPTDAIFFTREFEGSAVNTGNLVYSYVPEDVAKRFIRESVAAEKEKAKAAADQASGNVAQGQENKTEGESNG